VSAVIPPLPPQNLRLEDVLDWVQPEHLAHIVHAMRVSGRLARLSRPQLEAVVYALHASGLLDEGVYNLIAASLRGEITYNQDGLACVHNASFLRDERFVAAYRRGVEAAGADYPWHWRVRVGLWAADHARRLEGDFVECGVYRGFLSSAIMRYLDWNRLGKRFFLLDTFRGLDEAFISEEERLAGKTAAYGGYRECFEDVQRNFAEFRNVVLIRGSVPLTLPQVSADKVCYLHIDMNCAPPEVAAAAYFWDKLVPGAVVLLDDYANPDKDVQHCAMDRFAASRGVEVLPLPTGQGLMVRP
jgi:hypothetical protein